MENGTKRDDVVVFDDGVGTEWRIRFDTNAVSDFEDATGKSIVDAVYRSDQMTLGTIRTLLWAGLKWDAKRLTRERVGQLLEDFIVAGGKLQDLVSATVSAVEKSRLFQVLLGDQDPNSSRGAKTSPLSDSGSTSSE